jgi:hypothetical protein
MCAVQLLIAPNRVPSLLPVAAAQRPGKRKPLGFGSIQAAMESFTIQKSRLATGSSSPSWSLWDTHKGISLTCGDAPSLAYFPSFRLAAWERAGRGHQMVAGVLLLAKYRKTKRMGPEIFPTPDRSKELACGPWCSGDRATRSELCNATQKCLNQERGAQSGR